MKDFMNRNMVAHHEAGHAVFGHFFDIKIIEININYDLAKNIPAYTLKDYGISKPIIDIFENGQIEDLKPYDTNSLINIARIYCMSLLAGPIAETFFKFGVNYKNGIRVQNTPDFNLSIKVAKMIVGSKFQNFISDCSNTVTEILRDDVVWNTIIKLAENTMSSKDLRIFSKEIYNIFEFTQFNDYKQKISPN